MPISELEGGDEAIADLSGRAEVAVSPAALDETVDCGLFVTPGPSPRASAHRTYGEFLAARYISRSKLTLRRYLPLLTLKQAGQQRVVPQLRGVAGWLAHLEPHFMEWVIEHDPAIALTGDAPDDPAVGSATTTLAGCRGSGSWPARGRWCRSRPRSPREQWAPRRSACLRYSAARRSCSCPGRGTRRSSAARSSAPCDRSGGRRDLDTGAGGLGADRRQPARRPGRRGDRDEQGRCRAGAARGAQPRARRRAARRRRGAGRRRPSSSATAAMCPWWATPSTRLR